jgi:DNA-binding NarL/FixJ family response regulator
LEQIRILIANMPHMLREIIETLVSSEADMTVTGLVRRTESLATAARRLRADAVILGTGRREAGGTLWQTLDERPRLKLFAISPDGHRATRYELRPIQTVMDDISPEDLIRNIRVSLRGGDTQNASRPARQPQRRSDGKA